MSNCDYLDCKTEQSKYHFDLIWLCEFHLSKVLRDFKTGTTYNAEHQIKNRVGMKKPKEIYFRPSREEIIAFTKKINLQLKS